MEKKKLNSHSTDDMILYMEDLKDTTEKLLEFNEFGNVASYKIKTDKSTAKKREREICCISIH